MSTTTSAKVQKAHNWLVNRNLVLHATDVQYAESFNGCDWTSTGRVLATASFLRFLSTTWKYWWKKQRAARANSLSSAAVLGVIYVSCATLQCASIDFIATDNFHFGDLRFYYITLLQMQSAFAHQAGRR